MRRRLLLVLSVFALAAVAGFALPLLASTAAERTQRFVLTRSADLDRFATLAQQPDSGAALAQEAATYAGLYGEGVLVVDGAGRVRAAAGLDPADPGVADAVDAALRNLPPAAPTRLGPWSRTPVLLGRPVGTGTQVGGAVVLRASPAAAATDIGVAWAVVLGGGLAAAAAVAVLALLVARWVLRPVAELAQGVRAVADGRPDAHVSALAGPAELRDLAEGFNRMSHAVTVSAEQQRRLVADTSHQLRNPLAALRLRADTLDGQVPDAARPTYASMLAEVERMEGLLDDLLALAAADSAVADRAAGHRAGAERCAVAAVVAERVAAWAPAADAAGVRLAVTGGPEATAAAPGGVVAQVLDVLLDNAVKYAGAGATVTVSWASPDDGRVRLAVRDDGPGLRPGTHALATERFWRGDPGGDHRGTGLGLAIAAQLAASHGGRLAVDAAPAGGLAVTLDVAAAP